MTDEMTVEKFAAEYPHHKAGGPAFPFVSGEMTMYGMSIRDHFAGLAMQAIVQQKNWEEYAVGSIARWAYEQADAMLAERDK